MPDTPEPSPPTMHVLAGPNGAGKSTLYDLRLSRWVGAPFVNADRIQKAELRDQSMQGAYAAARIAEERRRAHLAEGASFVTESTFSHPSKLALVDDAKAAGFRVIVHHVGVRSAAMSIARVASRVRDGGHDVPAEKVVERFERNQPLIREAVLRADRAFVYDNSVAARPPRFLIEFRDGRVHRIGMEIAVWAMTLYVKELEHISRGRQNPPLASFDEAARIAAKVAGTHAAVRRGGDISFDYHGPIVGETALHWLQRHEDSNFTAHAKAHVAGTVQFGDRVRIAYDGPERAVSTPFGGHAAVPGETAEGMTRREAFLASPRQAALTAHPELASTYQAFDAMTSEIATAGRGRPLTRAQQRALLQQLRERIGAALATGRLLHIGDRPPEGGRRRRK
jgi:predicted ABC-type ATPase